MSELKSYNDTHLTQMRLQGDEVADNVVRNLFQIGYNPMVEQEYNAYQHNNQLIPESFPLSLAEYFKELKEQAEKIPLDYWVAGQSVFGKYAQELLATLGFLSLPYCYAAADGAQVLYKSKRIRQSPEKRLLETAAFVFDVSEVNAFSNEGKGIVSAGKVRLMHAAIRYHITKSGQWPASLGTPINQEDMAGTNLAFSLISIRGLRKLGYQVTVEEAWSFIDMWNTIGRFLGVSDTLLPSDTREAFNLDKAIAKRNFRKSKEGVALTKALHDYMRTSFSETGPIDPAAITAYLVGDQVAPMLGLKTGAVLPRIMEGVSGINALKSLLRQDGAQKLKEAKKLYETQISGKTLEPFRLLNNLTD